MEGRPRLHASSSIQISSQIIKRTDSVRFTIFPPFYGEIQKTCTTPVSMVNSRSGETAAVQNRLSRSFPASVPCGIPLESQGNSHSTAPISMFCWMASVSLGRAKPLFNIFSVASEITVEGMPNIRHFNQFCIGYPFYQKHVFLSVFCHLFGLGKF